MDAIIILGAAVWETGPSPTLQRRTAHAASLWHTGAAPVVVPCGGLGLHPPTEAAMMRELLLKNGVPDAQITPEDQSITTFENIRNAKPLLPGRDVIVVTDGYHGRRAAMVARHFGLNAVISSPAANGIGLRQRVKHHLREVAALPAYAIRLRQTPTD